MTDPNEDFLIVNFDEGIDYTGVEDEETLTPAQLGYTGEEDFTPEDLDMSDDESYKMESIRAESEEEAEDTHSPDDEGVETAVNDDTEM